MTQEHISSSTCIKGNNIELTEKRQVPSFNAIDIDGAFTCKIQCGQKRNLEITCDKNLSMFISTTVKDHKLVIYPTKPMCTKNPILLTITVPDLSILTTAGANDITITGIDNEQFSIVLDGQGSLKASGKTNHFKAILSGSSDLKAKELRTMATYISIDGSGDASVNASKDLNVDINGEGDVRYYGNPINITKNISGVGSIKAFQ